MSRRDNQLCQGMLCAQMVGLRALTQSTERAPVSPPPFCCCSCFRFCFCCCSCSCFRFCFCCFCCCCCCLCFSFCCCCCFSCCFCCSLARAILRAPCHPCPLLTCTYAKGDSASASPFRWEMRRAAGEGCQCTGTQAAQRHMYSYQKALSEAYIAVQAARRVPCHREREHACAQFACRTAFSVTAAGALLFMLRKALGTWNVPHLS